MNAFTAFDWAAFNPAALGLAAFNPVAFLGTLLTLGVAFILGTLIGAERQYRQRNAGLRTNALVALGAAAFVHLGIAINDRAGGTQIIAYVVSGIGFLGAGVIMKEGLHVRGLNTAATLWCSAAVGAFAGSGHLIEAILLTGFVLAGNTFLRPLVKLINRVPINVQATEATYQVRVTVDEESRDHVRDALVEKLEAASYPIRELDVNERSEEEVELIAVLTSTSVEPAELDAVTQELEKLEGVSYATWTSTSVD
jgi:putative Mg2+ transporter-C (MgtC) family protein